MTSNPEHIHIFKSNIFTDADKQRVSTVLDIHPHVEQWSVDLQDEDRILRIISPKLRMHQVVELVTLCGYQCEELPD